MEKYDDASWHFDGNFPKGLHRDHAATHIGMFLTWCIDNDLISDDLRIQFADEIQNVRIRKTTGRDILINYCDEKLIDDNLNEIGRRFVSSYYNDDTPFAHVYSSYLEDYSNVFMNYKLINKIESIYEIQNSWKNYQLIRTVIDKRFNEWNTKINVG